MEILKTTPPNYQRIKDTFDLTGFEPVFTYGSMLYNPSGNEIPQHLMIHEETHEKQQLELGIEMWWDLYLTNIEFRLKQEVEAYHNQYRFLCKYFGRDDRRFYLKQFAKTLSSKMYGNICSVYQAGELIKNG